MKFVTLGIFFNRSPIISLVILNLSGNVPSTGFTFIVTGLYFFAKQSTIWVGSSRLSSPSSTDITCRLWVSGIFISCRSQSRSKLSSCFKASVLFPKYSILSSSGVSSFPSMGNTSLTKGFPLQSRLIMQEISPLWGVSDSSRFTKNLPARLPF